MKRRPADAPPPGSCAQGVTLWIPMLPPSLNDWTTAHWHVRDRMKKDWEKAIELALMFKPRAMIGRGCRVYIWSFLKSKRRRDLDNLSPKAIMDGLVKSRALVDDSVKVVPELVMAAVAAPFEGTLIWLDAASPWSAGRPNPEDLMNAVHPGWLRDCNGTLEWPD